MAMKAVFACVLLSLLACALAGAPPTTPKPTPAPGPSPTSTPAPGPGPMPDRCADGGCALYLISLYLVVLLVTTLAVVAYTVGGMNYEYDTLLFAKSKQEGLMNQIWTN
eukprot:CAMPEP_0114555504 /NCGR_PEP_ID=MMETSP0114-20121206/8783_1 /TAXON_ID=31324 /ORGANISM="Goniomonas sp, Strain m" /LENGTH=108 /DNA_ID=CAMNT_0001740631 /DNA_START=19 /DNA_END=345 /DNA_ORIENTATION=-